MTEEEYLVHLYQRSSDLLRWLQQSRGPHMLRPGIHEGRDRDAANRYNALRRDVQRFARDPHFARQVLPPAWALQWWQVVGGLLALAGSGLVLHMVEPTAIYGLVTFVILGGMVIAMSGAFSSGGPWYWASSRELVRNRAAALHDYLRGLLREYPGLARQVDPGKLQAQIEYLEEEQRNHWQWEAAQERAAQHWQELWAGLSEPLPFDLAEGTLAKLDPLEQTRLREAVQAYRVRAWTPAAAVAGMLLEGRLQRLCRDNGVEVGGMNAMIERLGAAGLLGGHHQDLARLGEFFRHRAAHPTSEVFDQEKTTLILTLLLLLVRDVF